MRKKIEELRNREEGFTLVELLAVIVILGIIVAIAIPAVGSIINTADDNATKAEKSLVEDAGRLYATTEQPDIPAEGLTIGTTYLIEKGYLENRSTGDVQGSVVITQDENENYEYNYNSGNTDARPSGETPPAASPSDGV